MTNTLNAKVVLLTHELEDKIMAALPPEVRAWIRENAVDDLDPREIFRAWRSGMTPAEILNGLEAVNRNKTKALYGWGHPQAFLPRAA